MLAGIVGGVVDGQGRDGDRHRDGGAKGEPKPAAHPAGTRVEVRIDGGEWQPMRRVDAADPALVEDVIMGCVGQGGEQAVNVARNAVLAAGFPESVPATSVDRQCGSSQQSLHFAAQAVMSGAMDCVIAAGVESMSRVPMGSDGGAWPVDPSSAFPTYFVPQGVSADMIATKYGFSRDDVDAYAVESQKRSAASWAAGNFAKSVIPVKDGNGLVILDRDEHMRPGTDMQSLASLNPSFQMPGEMGGFEAVAIQAHPEIERINYIHHAGNSSGIVDGAAAVLVGSKAGGESMGLKPRARIRAFTNIGSDPALMLTGPVDVTEKLLKRTGMKISDFDLFELNEAFAAVVLRFMQHFNVDHSKMNVAGGAIAMGHPLGATGAMILGTVLDELERRDLNTALVTLCIGAGMDTKSG